MQWLERVNNVVWGAPALILILAVGTYFSVRTGFAQLRYLPLALKLFFSRLWKKEETNGKVTPFQALCTALAATVGTGNLAGVAGAIALGGPGAIFWMWISGILGMITKYAEAVLAIRYRTKNENRETVGGPMYIIENAMGNKWKWLSGIYAFFGVVAAFGVGNATQINTLIGGINTVMENFGQPVSAGGKVVLGIILAIFIAILLLGGAKRIGKIAEILVPFAALLYILLGMGVLAFRASAIPEALRAIVQGAFSPQAVTGGAVGSAFRALRVGTARGVFTNEAGMGTAAIAHAGADVGHPAEQGLMGIVEVFVDTIVICTMTALVILCSGVPIPYGIDQGVDLTNAAFAAIYGRWVTVFIAVALGCFAIATILGWGLYGARCAQYLFGQKAWRPFVLLQAVAVIAGSMLGTGTVWLLAETVNGLMAIPNLIALAKLRFEVKKITNSYNRTLVKK